MKRCLFFLLLLLPIIVNAQGFSYDTIKVAPDDSRNIHTYREQTTTGNNNIANSTQHTVFDKNKLRFGANLGLSVSRNYTNLGLGPQVGYQFNRYFLAGAGLKYYYYRAKLSNYENRNNLLGLNMFGYVYPIRFITLFAQPEINYIWSKTTYSSTNEVDTSSGLVPSLVVGAGLRLGYTHFTINYDLIQRSNSPHPDGFYLSVSAFF